MIQNVSTDTGVIKELGGQDNIKRIQQKLENEWDKKPSYDYINYLKTTIIECFEKYEKDCYYIENTVLMKNSIFCSYKKYIDIIKNEY